MPNKKNNTIFVRSGFLITLFFILIFNLYYALPPKEEIQVMVHNPNLPYPLRERLKMGSPFYEYIQFIKTNIPEGATVILPPQESDWGLYGNFFYMQYYLYPRQLVGSSYFKGNPKNADYALVVKDKAGIWPPRSLIKGIDIKYLQTNPELGIINLKK